MSADTTPPAVPQIPEEQRTLTMAARPAARETAARQLPGAIGRYRILGLLGEGGMGAVYEAEQEQPRRTVALKVIKAGWAGPELQRRFEQESQALGRLHHPGIAQIYEAGSADTGFGSQPYFAMELIHGKTLCDYAHAKHLSTRERLTLMVQVCEAVQHAHQRGIIHRDLKPGNILVDENGQPKILDFGLARVTDSDAQATRQTDMGQLLGTLAYMSPEQVLADPLAVDTRSDVYALGVILYELLSGKLPYTITRNLHEAVQTIRAQDPVPLSAVSRVYRGDVETIVTKVLEKDRERRYASAADLAADIRRHLDDRPILATPPSATYQLRKFARRHKALVMGIAAVLAALVMGIVASTLEAIHARRAEQAAVVERDHATSSRQQATEERDRASNERNRALAAEAQAIREEAKAVEERNKALIAQRKAATEAATSTAISDFLRSDLLGQASAGVQARPDNRPDPDLKVRTALDRAAARIGGKFKEMPLVEASLRMTMGNTYRDLGLFAEAQRELELASHLRRRNLGSDDPETLDVIYALGLTYVDLGKYPQAEELFSGLLEVNRRRWGQTHLKTLKSINGLAIAFLKQGKYPTAETLFAEELDGARKTLGEEDTQTFEALNNLASVYYYEGKFERAAEYFSKALEVARRVQGDQHPSTMTTMGNLATIEMTLGHLERAESLRMQVTEILRRTLGNEHSDTLRSLHDLAGLYLRQRKYAEAERLAREVWETQGRVYGADHPDTLRYLETLGNTLTNQGKDADASTLYAQALEGRRRILGSKHPDTLASMGDLGVSLQAQGKYGEAEPVFTEAWNTSRETLGREHRNTLARMERLAAVWAMLGKYDQSAALYTDALEIRRRVSGPDAAETAGTMVALGAVLNRRQDFGHAEPLLREALAIREKSAPQTWGRFNAESLLGVSVEGQGKPREAEPLLREGAQGLLDHRSEIPAASLFYLDSGVQALVRLYQNLSEPEKALEWQRKLKTPH